MTIFKDQKLFNENNLGLGNGFSFYSVWHFLIYCHRERRDAMAEAATKHLTGVAEWSLPGGGMFLWLRVPEIEDTWDMLLKRGLEKNIMLLPGNCSFPNHNFISAH